jgi:hypothetical protein
MEGTLPKQYHCDCCNYTCYYLSHWNQHANTETHKNGGIRPPVKNKKDPKCCFCDFATTLTTNMKLHYLNHHATLEDRKTGFTYYCEECDIGCFTKALYKAHLESKHSSV